MTLLEAISPTAHQILKLKPTPNDQNMSAAFREMMTQLRGQAAVEELLQCGGEYHVTRQDAIVADWQHALLQALTDATEHTRFLSGEDDAHHRRCLKRDLAKLAAVAEAMAEKVNTLD